MSVFYQLYVHLRNAVTLFCEQGILSADCQNKNFVVEPPRNAQHGDLSTNIAMVLSKSADCSPRDLAERFCCYLKETKQYSEVSIAGPGFINVRLPMASWYQEVQEIISKGPDYGRNQQGQGQSINLEYVSANPTGPLHVGHVRGAVFGDILANLMVFCGYHVVREYYVNDAGSQIDNLANSLYWRYQQALGQDVPMPENGYPGTYLEPVGQQLAKEDGDKWLNVSRDQWLPRLRGYAVEKMLLAIQKDLADLGIYHDIFFSEAGMIENGNVQKTLEKLQQKGLVYTGVLPPPEGEEDPEWVPREQLLFRSSSFSDDRDRPFCKADGSWTYFASDVAYHDDKCQRKYDHLINVWGADHGGYVSRIAAAVKALTQDSTPLDVCLCQMVHLYQNGQPCKMSKRSGNFVTLQELKQMVHPDIIRFMMVSRRNDAQLDFDITLAKEQSRDNPVFYVQYAHARIASVFIQAREQTDIDIEDSALKNADLTCLQDEAERQIIRLLAQYPRIIHQALQAREPHRIAFYLQELASEFHAFWNKGKENTNLRFLICDNVTMTKARLCLIRSIQFIIVSGLNILGITPMERMG